MTGRNPETEWTATDYLLAGAIDVLRAGNYQRGGGKGRKPEPIRRPSDPGPENLLVGDVMTPAELDAELLRRYAKREERD